MIVDASALVAIIQAEPEAFRLSRRLASAPHRFTHAISAYEATLAVVRLTDDSVDSARRLLEDFQATFKIGTVDLGPNETSAALDAFARYGRGRHPAALNMGDCFSYACAKLRGMPLLYRGDDFARTDLA